MKSLCRLIACTFFLAVSVLPFKNEANAEPGEVPRWLMQTPTSLWTFGLAELSDYVYGWRGDSAVAQSLKSVHYDWEKNRIKIVLINETNEFSESLCRSMLEELRKRGFVRDGEVFGGRVNSLYAERFSRGFVSGDEPEHYLQEIDNIIALRVQLEGGNCKGDLLSTAVYYQ